MCGHIHVFLHVYARQAEGAVEIDVQHFEKILPKLVRIINLFVLLHSM